MIKILFISENIPLGFNYTGISSLITSHLRSLLLLSIRKEIIFLTLPTYKNRPNYEFESFPNKNSILKEKCIFSFNYTPHSTLKKALIFLSTTNRLKRENVYYSFINQNNINDLQFVVDRIKPDIIWAENIIPYIFVTHLKYNGKVIYSHHDFLWKLKLIRRNKIKDRIEAYMLKNIQDNALKKVKWIVGGAKNELRELSCLSKNSSTLFLPTIYPRKVINNKLQLSTKFRIIHLGTIKATANRIGLKILLKDIIPSLNHKNIQFECWIVGDLSSADEELKLLMKQPSVFYKGYIQDLDEVLFPNDIHIIPYNKATGTRTRVTLALNYQQVLVAHKSSVEGYEGLTDGCNCLLSSSTSEMIKKLEMLSKKIIDKNLLAKNGKEWYDENFKEVIYANKLSKWIKQ